MSVVRNLLVRGGADFSAMVKSMKAAQKQVQGFKEKFKSQFGTMQKNVDGFGKSMQSAAKTIGISYAGFELGNYLVEATKDAISMQSALGSLSRTLGLSAKSFEIWANSSAISFNLSKKEALEFGRTYAQMVSIFSKDTEQTKSMTIELLKASAIVASGTGRTMQDVMERISSGLRGETDSIEDLGIFVSESMIKSTDAFKKFAGNKSWSQLSIQMQKQIIYMSILEQAHKQYGDSIQNNMSSQIQQLSANLSDLKVKLGDAIIPALNQIMPYLIQFASFLKNVIDAWRQFFYTLSGNEGFIQSYSYSLDNAAQSMSNVTKNANAATDSINDAKDAIKGLAGFDEINQLGSSATAAANTILTSKNSGGQNQGSQLNSLDPSMFTSQNAGMKSFAESINKYFENFKIGWEFLFGGETWTARFEKMKTNIGLIFEIFKLNFEKQWGLVFGSIDWSKKFELTKTVLTSVVDLYKNNFEAGWKYFFGPIDWTKRFDTGKSTLISVVETYKKNFEAGWTYLFELVEWKKRFESSKKWLTDAINTYKSNFEIGWNYLFEKIDWKERFKTLKTTLSDAVDAYIKNFKAGWDYLFGGSDNSSNTDTPQPKKSILNVKPINKMAKGGIVDSPTMAMIGEAGPEMIMPLEQTSFTDKLAGALGTAVMSAMQMSGGGNVTGSNKEVILKIDGYTIARALNPYLKKESNRQGNTVISIY